MEKARATSAARMLRGEPTARFPGESVACMLGGSAAIAARKAVNARKVLLSILEAHGPAAAAIPQWVVAELRSAAAAPGAAATDSTDVEGVSAWIIANPWELKKCRSMKAVLSNVGQKCGDHHVDGDGLPEVLPAGACSEATAPLRDPLAIGELKAGRSLAHLMLLAARRAARNVLQEANVKEGSQVRLKVAAGHVQARVTLAQGLASPAAAAAAAKAAAAAVEMVTKRFVVRRVPMRNYGIRPTQIGELIGKQGRFISPLIASLTSAAEAAYRAYSPKLKLEITDGVKITCMVMRAESSPVSCDLSALGDSFQQLVEQWLVQAQTRIATTRQWLAQRLERRGQAKQTEQATPGCRRAMPSLAELVHEQRDWMKERREAKRGRDLGRRLRRQQHMEGRQSKQRKTLVPARLRDCRNRRGHIISCKPARPTRQGLLGFERALDAAGA